MNFRLTALRFSAILLTFFLLTGCDSIYDRLGNCFQGIDLHLYVQTPCDDSPEYPAAIKQVHVFLFDRNGILLDELSQNAVTIGPQHFVRIPIGKPGKYTFAVWAADSFEGYGFTPFERGKTTFDDMRMAFQPNVADKMPQTTRLYTGSCTMEVTEDMSTRAGNPYETLGCRLTELTYDIHFSIHGLSKDGSYSLSVSDMFYDYDFSGAERRSPSAPKDVPLVYREESYTADFTVTGLGGKTIPHKVTIRDLKKRSVIYEAELGNGIILYSEEAGDPPYNPLCDHTYKVDVRLVEEHDTWTLLQVSVNGWNVIRRPVILGQ